ncbi:hypothetical protein KIW84_046139 [Lathyrus oleraceus]|uniref:Uncharacterized protein n=1 Tax=Pisum sativum TaxID=3888 RepID=A0A9D4XMG0_PEA|nr:hypothetical protein KIW84_046139 [Pisum sativum]
MPNTPLLAYLIKDLFKLGLHDQIQYRTIVAPLFCYNYVEPQYPNVVAKQFEELDGINLTDVGFDMGVIISKGNKVNNPINFKAHFKKELRQWEDIDRRFAQNFQTIETSTFETASDIEASSETASDHQSPNIENSTSGDACEMLTVDFEAYGISVVNFEETNSQLEENEVGLNDNVEDNAEDIGDENVGGMGGDGSKKVPRRGIATPPPPLTSDRRKRSYNN